VAPVRQRRSSSAPSARRACADCIVDSVGGRQTSALRVAAHASFLNCTFQNNHVKGKENLLITVEDRGALYLRNYTLRDNLGSGFDIGRRKNSRVRRTWCTCMQSSWWLLQSCRRHNNALVQVYAQPDRVRELMRSTYPLGTTDLDGLEYDELVLDDSAVPADTFLSEQDTFYRDIRAVRNHATHACCPAPLWAMLPDARAGLVLHVVVLERSAASSDAAGGARGCMGCAARQLCGVPSDAAALTAACRGQCGGLQWACSGPAVGL
jgi:hypothetical protein